MGVLDVPDGECEGQMGEGFVGADLVEGALEAGGRCVGLEGVEGAAAGGFVEVGGEGGGGGAGEEGDGEVAVRGGREDACDARGCGGAGAEEDGEAGGMRGHSFFGTLGRWSMVQFSSTGDG